MKTSKISKVVPTNATKVTSLRLLVSVGLLVKTNGHYQWGSVNNSKNEKVQTNFTRTHHS
jgi:hypothetical protein